MKRFLAVLLACGATQAWARDPTPPDIYSWFDQKGNPTAGSQAWAERSGLPRLVEGRPFATPEQGRKPGCVTVQFYIRPDGATAGIAVLESKPKGYFDQSVVEFVRLWEFQQISRGRWGQVTLRIDQPPSEDLAAICVTPRVDVDSTAEVLEGPPAAYPPTFLAKRTQGCVALTFAVGSDGLANDFEIDKSAPGNAFIDAAINAVSAWRLKPSAAGARQHAVLTFRIPEVERSFPKCGGRAKAS